MNLFARRILQVVLVLLVPVFAHGNDKAQPHKHKKKLYQNPSTKRYIHGTMQISILKSAHLQLILLKAKPYTVKRQCIKEG